MESNLVTIKIPKWGLGVITPITVAAFVATGSYFYTSHNERAVIRGTINEMQIAQVSLSNEFDNFLKPNLGDVNKRLDKLEQKVQDGFENVHKDIDRIERNQERQRDETNRKLDFIIESGSERRAEQKRK